MVTVKSRIEALKTESLEGLDQSSQALEKLRGECRQSADLLVGDLISGAVRVSEVAESIHDFLTFEQEIVDLFNVDAAQIVEESDSLERVEKDMYALLASFDEKMEAMDVIGVAELLRNPVPDLLLRFEKMLPALRGFVYEFIHQ